MQKVFMLLALLVFIAALLTGFSLIIFYNPDLRRWLAGPQGLLISFMLVTSMLGGFIGHICRNNGGIILPYFRRMNSPNDLNQTEKFKVLQQLEEQINLKLGVLSDVLIGMGAGVASLFLLDNKEITMLSAISGGFVAGFLGQTLIQMVTDKVQNVLGLAKIAKLGSSAYLEIGYVLNDLLELLSQALKEDKVEAQKNMALKLPEVKTKIARIEELSKSQDALLTNRLSD